MIYEMSKARHLYRSVSLIPFLYFQTTSSLNYTNFVRRSIVYIGYKLRLFMAKEFHLLKPIITGTGWGAVSIIFKVFDMTQTRRINRLLTWLSIFLHIHHCLVVSKASKYSPLFTSNSFLKRYTDIYIELFYWHCCPLSFLFSCSCRGRKKRQ